jgi:hypothetical protein
METIQTQANYVEWLNAGQMHEASKEWLSELRFIKDEHLFFEDLIKSYTLQLISPEKFSHNKEIIDALNRSQKRNNFFIEAVKVHENELQIMVDGVNELKKEDAYKKEHRGLIIEIGDYQKNYRSLKMQLFDILKVIKKEEKQRRLIDRR